ncbi:penicillin-binding protein 1B [Rheinheimera tilapiae]|uniref:Penicillin-binding protein 1B n=1 Tax=Rheinheimera tilapiae TaxID=875043 RepID=A0ABV6BDF5_9GAMM
MTAKRKPTKKSPMNPLLRTVLVFGLKVSLLLLAAISIYLIYLDSKITTLFSGHKWQVPAQLYGRTLELTPGSHLSQVQFLDELSRLQYSADPRLNGPGQYHVSGATVTVVRRAFEFPDGADGVRRFTVEFAGDFVQRLSTGDKPLQKARLEPQLLQHLVAAEQEDRELIRLADVPVPLRETLLLVEDREFYNHHGVSPLSIIRAFWQNLLAGRTVQGGSTLTQQLAKNMYTNQQRTYLRKVNEALIALVLDFRYSKDQILEAYLNEIFIGQFKDNPVHGLGLGSRLYFGKPLAELKPHEYAMLVGIIKGPSVYDPRRYADRALSRRDLILDLMAEHGILNHDQHNAAKQQPLDVIPLGQHLKGRFPAYIDKVRQELRQLVPDTSKLQQGLRVFTYLDPMAQQAAEQAMAARLSQLNDKIEGAMLVTDYQRGALKAIIGGRQMQYAGYNRALSARRQIGSIVKPVVYLGALQQPQQFHLGSVLQDSPMNLRSGSRSWQPQNYDKKFRGPVPIVAALSQSLNIPTVRLGMQVGLPVLAGNLRKLGLERDVQLQPSSLLGAVELSPYEVAQLYQTMANKGLYLPLAAVSAITTQDGQVLHQRKALPEQRVAQEPLYLLQYALNQATQNGTAGALAQQFPRVRFAGKTGTSSDYRDSWFSGFDHETAIVVWLGRDDNQAIGLTGGSGALPVFSGYFAKMPPNSLFRAVPDKIRKQFISKLSGRVVAESCVNVLLLPVISVEMPLSNTCD